MSALASMVQTGYTPRPRRIFIYGVGGIGKTTFAAMAPKPIFIQTEEGLDDIIKQSGMHIPRFPLATTYEQVISYIDALISDQHDYGTVVLDSADWLETLIHAKTCAAKGVDSIDQVPWGKGYLTALNDWTAVLKGLEHLRQVKQMNVILIGHANIKRHETPLISDVFDRYVPKLDKRTSAKIVEWCDDVLFATYKVDTRQVSEQGELRKRFKGIDRGRILVTCEQPGVVAKNRCGLPPEIPLSWQAYSEIAFGTAAGVMAGDANNDNEPSS